MAVALFTKGTIIEIENRHYRLNRQVDKGVWQIEDLRSGRWEQRNFRELQQLLVEQKLCFVHDIPYGLDERAAEIRRKRDEASIAEMTVDDRKEVRRKHAYVLALMGLPATEVLVRQAIEEAWKQLGGEGEKPCWTTVLRWKSRYLMAGCDALELRELRNRKGNRARRYPDKVIDIVQEAIEQVYLTLERKTVQDVVDQAISMVEHENKLRPESMQLPMPTRRLVQGQIDDIDAYDKHAARFGRLAAVIKFRGARHINVTERPLECAEIDHTRADIFVIDDETGLPLGRPWITACIDRHTRCILGIYITFAPPSFLSVARCLKHAILPKLDLQQQYPKIEHEWLAHGVMSKLVVDNGREFHSESLEKACLALGIDLQFTPRKTPWFKGQIERFLGTLNRGVAHGNPGTTFSSILDKDDYDPEKHAAVTYSTFKLVMHKWIADVYHQKPHRALDRMTPADVWDNGIQQEDIPLPDSVTRLDAILGKAEQRKLTHKGIELHGLRYNSDELVAYRRRCGSKLDVDVRVDEGDLGHIHVIAHDKSEIFRVRCLQYDYACGLSKWQHDMLRKYTRTTLDIADCPEGWCKAKSDIAAIIGEDISRKRGKSTRKIGDRIARHREENQTGSALPAARPASVEELAAPAAIPALTASPSPRKFTPIVTDRTTI